MPIGSRGTSARLVDASGVGIWVRGLGCTRKSVDSERRGRAYDPDSEVELLDGARGSFCDGGSISRMDHKKIADDFQRMLQLAEVGAKWHDDRRQVTFRIFVSYMTLLVLALYQVIKLLGEKDVVISGWIILFVIAGLVFTHCIYCKWQGTIRKALINDIRRRDFYLKKAELIFYYLSEDSNLSSIAAAASKSDEQVVLNLGSGDKTPISKSALFKQEEPDIITGDRIGKKNMSGKYLECRWWQDIHFLTLTVGPTFLLILLILLMFTLFLKRLGWFG